MEFETSLAIAEDKKLVITFGTKHVQLKDGGVPPASSNFDQALKQGSDQL